MELLGKTLAQASTGAYADIVSLQIPPGVTKLSVFLKEKNVNAIKYKIIAGMNGTDYPYEITGETVIAKDAQVYETPTSNTKLADPMLHVKVQIIDSVPPNHGSVDCWVANG